MQTAYLIFVLRLAHNQYVFNYNLMGRLSLPSNLPTSVYCQWTHFIVKFAASGGVNEQKFTISFWPGWDFSVAQIELFGIISKKNYLGYWPTSPYKFSSFELFAEILFSVILSILNFLHFLRIGLCGLGYSPPHVSSLYLHLPSAHACCNIPLTNI